ncbi:unnamed protein product [Arctia plantaginis]|uniref:Uncharacterized protein n=1 Tax=Arctia plantaginis TaxID=874455 RepID=A0A8S0ZBF0_ARCPL|nr:unnamed protein product [Arctia plantaginis]
MDERGRRVAGGAGWCGSMGGGWRQSRPARRAVLRCRPRADRRPALGAAPPQYQVWVCVYWTHTGECP